MSETRVAIVGAGPAGMLLSHLLDRAGVDNMVVERQSRQYVLDRIRAGVLEWGTVETLREAGLGTRMDAEGHVHDTINMAWRGQDVLSVDTNALLGKQMMAYGQTRIQQDLYDAAEDSRTSTDASSMPTTSSCTRIDTSHRPFGHLRRTGADTERIDVRLRRRLRWLPRCQPGRRIPAVGAHRVREGLSVRVARHPVRDPTATDPALRQPRARVRALLDAQPDAEPLLRPGADDRHDRRLVGRPVLGRSCWRDCPTARPTRS